MRWQKFAGPLGLALLAFFSVSIQGGCVCRSHLCPSLELSKLRQGVNHGDVASMRALVEGVAQGRWTNVTLREAIAHASNLAASGIPSDLAMLGLLAEAVGNDQKAFTQWLMVAADRESEATLAWAVLSWAERLVDRVDLEPAYQDLLVSALARQDRAGEMAAELAYAMASRWNRDALRMQAVKRKGWIRSYLRGGRIGPLPVAAFEGGQLHGRLLSARDGLHPFPFDAWPSVTTPDGSIAFADEGPGVYVARWALPASHHSTEVEVWTKGTLWLESGGEVLLVHDGLSQYGPKRTFAVIEAGEKRVIEVFVASRDSAPEVRIAARPLFDADSDFQLNERQGLLGVLVSFERALRDADLAVLTRQAKVLEQWPHGLCVSALTRFHQMDPSRPESVTDPIQIDLLQRAIERFPDHLGARRSLVERRLLANEVEQARSLIKSAPNPPKGWKLEMDLALTEADGNEGQHRGLSQTLLDMRPTSCTAFDGWLSSQWDRLRYRDTVRQLQPPGCVESQLRFAQLLLEIGAFARAKSVLKGIMLRAKPGQQQSQVQEALGHIAYRQNDWVQAQQHWMDALAQGVRRETLVENLIRLLRLGEDDAGAEALIAAATEASSTSPSQQHAFLTLDQDLGFPLLDGRVLALEAQARRLQSKAHDASFDNDDDRSVEVLLEDRFIRVLPNGSSVHRVHLIFQILDAHRAEQWGEVPLPAEAEVLVARTWKPTPDGDLQPIEPEDLMNLGVVSLSALEAGAVGEVAYVWVVPASTSLAPGWMTPVIFLERTDAVLRHGRFRLRVPAANEVFIQRTGDVPEPQVLQGDTRLYQWEVRDRVRKKSEPLDPRPERRLASVQVGSSVSTESLRTHYWVQLLSRLRVSPTLHELVDEALGPLDQPARSKLKHLYEFVLDQVQAGEGGPWSGNASFIAATRAGERTLLLVAMCRVAGLACDFVLARPNARGLQDHPGSLPNADDWVYPLIRAKLSSGDIWLDPSHTYVPFGYLPPMVQGVPALLLGDGPVTVQTPKLDTQEGECHVSVKVELDADGQFVVRAKETMTGLYAMSWRHALVSMGQEIRHRALGRVLRRILPAVQEVDVRIGSLEKRGAPLTLNWEGRGRLLRNQAAFDLSLALYADELSASTVLLPQRQTPLFSNHANALTMTVTVSLPKGWQVVTQLQNEEVRHPLLQYHREARFDGQTERLVLRKTFRLKPGLISAEAYPSWVMAARAVDRADVIHLKLVAKEEESQSRPLEQ